MHISLQKYTYTPLFRPAAEADEARLAISYIYIIYIFIYLDVFTFIFIYLYLYIKMAAKNYYWRQTPLFRPAAEADEARLAVFL
jgi:hypothetical protein